MLPPVRNRRRAGLRLAASHTSGQTLWGGPVGTQWGDTAEKERIAQESLLCYCLRGEAVSLSPQDPPHPLRATLEAGALGCKVMECPLSQGSRAFAHAFLPHAAHVTCPY